MDALCEENGMAHRFGLPWARGRIARTAAIFILLTFLYNATWPGIAQTPSPLPFSALGSGDSRLESHHDGSARVFTLRQGPTVWRLPADVVPQQVLPAKGKLLLLGREALSGAWRAFHLLRQGSVEELKVDPALARRLLLFHAFVAEETTVLVAYDVEETFASGRSGSVVRDGVDIFRLETANGAVKLSKIVDKSPLAGIDNAIRDIAIPGGHLVCGQSSCLRLRREGSELVPESSPFAPKGWEGFVQVELFLRGGEPRALLRRDDDDRFTPPPAPGSVIFRDCPALGHDGCIDLPPDKLPSGVDADGRIRFVESCADVGATLERDLTRLPNGGLTFIGMNNHEGRIPWGQVYVLDGMLDAAEGKALQGAMFDPLRRRMRDRAALEVSYWALAAATERPWLWSRRYSIERRDIASVVHLGRMARVASRLVAIRPDLLPALDPLFLDLRRTLWSFERIVEEQGDRALKFRRGADFWFDGGNAAWNYQSAWIEGTAALERFGPAAPSVRQFAATLVEEFVAAEIAPRRPELWRYCAGLCQDGWSAADGVSINTPNWEGNKTRTDTAHVSYRAMDARAVLEAIRVWGLPGIGWFPAYARDLVERGWLYPMVGAPLADHGLRPRLHASLVGRYGRAAIPFDIHNQIWALDQLARNLGCDRR